MPQKYTALSVVSTSRTANCEESFCNDKLAENIFFAEIVPIKIPFNRRATSFWEGCQTQRESDSTLVRLNMSARPVVKTSFMAAPMQEAAIMAAQVSQ